MFSCGASLLGLGELQLGDGVVARLLRDELLGEQLVHAPRLLARRRHLAAREQQRALRLGAEARRIGGALLDARLDRDQHLALGDELAAPRMHLLQDADHGAAHLDDLRRLDHAVELGRRPSGRGGAATGRARPAPTRRVAQLDALHVTGVRQIRSFG